MILYVDKPTGYTSLDCVSAVRSLVGTRKVGHTGTLDPLATGVLVVLTEESTKVAEYIKDVRKTYRAVLKLGMTTDTQDVTGKILSKEGFEGGFSDLEEALPSFIGEISQLPPMYSAIKIGGVKLCDAARKGVEIEREERKITVYSLKAEKTDQNDEFVLEIDCSAGTYVRTLCEDIGKKLGCGGVMKELRRTSVDGVGLDKCRTLDELRAMSKEELFAFGLPTEEVLTGYEKVSFPAFFERLYRNGCEIYLKKVGFEGKYPENTLLRVADGNGKFFSLGRVRAFPDGLAVKSEKMF